MGIVQQWNELLLTEVSAPVEALNSLQLAGTPGHRPRIGGDDAGGGHPDAGGCCTKRAFKASDQPANYFSPLGNTRRAITRLPRLSLQHISRRVDRHRLDVGAAEINTN